MKNCTEWLRQKKKKNEKKMNWHGQQYNKTSRLQKKKNKRTNLKTYNQFFVSFVNSTGEFLSQKYFRLKGKGGGNGKIEHI